MLHPGLRRLWFVDLGDGPAAPGVGPFASSEAAQAYATRAEITGTYTILSIGPFRRPAPWFNSPGAASPGTFDLRVFG